MVKRNLAAAVETGWRVFLLNGQEAMAAVGLSGGGAPAKFRAINYGQFVRSAQRGIEAAEAAPPGKSPNYDLRTLEAPAIHLVSLWLHGSADNLFIPLEPAPPPFTAQKVYHELELAFPVLFTSAALKIDP